MKFPSDADVAIKPQEPPLPFHYLWPIFAGAAFGVVLRVIYWLPQPEQSTYSVMGIAFIYVAPFAIGAVTVYLAEKRERRSWAYYFWAPVFATACFVIGTVVIMIEGLICAILAVPLFGLMAAVGGLIMGAICRMTNWPKHAVYGIALLPLVLGAVPGQDVIGTRPNVIERTQLIDAPPERVWNEIMYTRDIKPEEVEHAFIYRIGVPLPQAGVVESTADGQVRKLTMGKSVHFDQVVTDWQENRHVRFTYRFYDDSFPPYALDDHVKIGGRYFDMVDTEYTLTPAAANSTSLQLTMRYRVKTSFNWYADPVAQLLIGNFEDVVLEFYRHRATR
jgi:uncharacterized protein YndB with AHSA1/START domain